MKPPAFKPGPIWHLKRTVRGFSEKIQHNVQSSFDPKDYDSVIKNNNVAIFSVDYCPHCTNTKNLVKQQGEKAWVVEVNQLSNEAEVRQFLNETTGQRTFPKNFVHGKFIGGNSDLVTMLRSNPNALKK